MSMFDFLRLGPDRIWHGQLVVYLLAFCSFVSLAIILERAFFFRKMLMDRRKFMESISKSLKRGKIIEAVGVCDRARHPLGRIVKGCLLKHDRGREVIKETAAETAEEELPPLESHLDLLATLGYTAPLLGLLGTVLGIMEVFRRLEAAQGLGTPVEFAGGIWETLLTTAGGLVIATIVLIAHNYLSGRVNSFLYDAEQCAREIANILEDFGSRGRTR